MNDNNADEKTLYTQLSNTSEESNPDINLEDAIFEVVFELIKLTNRSGHESIWKYSLEEPKKRVCELFKSLDIYITKHSEILLQDNKSHYLARLFIYRNKEDELNSLISEMGSIFGYGDTNANKAVVDNEYKIIIDNLIRTIRSIESEISSKEVEGYDKWFKINTNGYTILSFLGLYGDGFGIRKKLELASNEYTLLDKKIIEVMFGLYSVVYMLYDLDKYLFNFSSVVIDNVLTFVDFNNIDICKDNGVRLITRYLYDQYSIEHLARIIRSKFPVNELLHRYMIYDTIFYGSNVEILKLLLEKLGTEKRFVDAIKLGHNFRNVYSDISSDTLMETIQYYTNVFDITWDK